MHASSNRRSATKVKGGSVQPKNRRRPTGHVGCVLDREPSGRGCRHVVSKRDVQAFIEIIPEWERFSERLERIVLTRYNGRSDGEHAFYHREETGAIFLRAWSEDLWIELERRYFEAHEALLGRLGVVSERRQDGVMCWFTESQARAFMLLHVFMHELGHHVDRISQKHLQATKGEDYAERFATSRFEQLLPVYVRIFGDPARSA